MQWHEIEKIVETLEEYHPAVEIDELSLTDLRDLIIDLDDFSDDPDGVKDSDLKKILEAWIYFREEN